MNENFLDIAKKLFKKPTPAEKNPTSSKLDVPKMEMTAEEKAQLEALKQALEMTPQGVIENVELLKQIISIWDQRAKKHGTTSLTLPGDDALVQLLCQRLNPKRTIIELPPDPSPWADPPDNYSLVAHITSDPENLKRFGVLGVTNTLLDTDSMPLWLRPNSGYGADTFLFLVPTAYVDTNLAPRLPLRKIHPSIRLGDLPKGFVEGARKDFSHEGQIIDATGVIPPEFMLGHINLR